MSESELKSEIEGARLEVMEADKEIASIRSKIRDLPYSEDTEDAKLDVNSLTLVPTKISGLPESAKPKISIQCSSPIEEQSHDFSLSSENDIKFKFTDVDKDAATLVVSVADVGIPLGSSALLDVKPLTENDDSALEASYQIVQELDVAIVSDDGEGKEDNVNDETVQVAKEQESTTEEEETQTIIKPIIFCGPSGAGKGTLINILFEKFQGKLGFSVSHTTRQPRQGEEDGVHYNFTSVDAMKQEIADDKFIEYAEVHGNYYGTSVESVEKVSRSGKICVLDIDVQGVQKVKESNLDAICVFVAPPSMEALEARLRGRGTEKEEDIQKRLNNASGEMEYGQTEGNFDRYLINDDLDRASKELMDMMKGFYPYLKDDVDSETLLNEDSQDKKSSSALIPTCVVSFRVVYHPSSTERKEALYDALSKASKRKTAAIEKLRKGAAALNRLKSDEEGDDKSGKSPAVKSGFLNKKTSTKKEPMLLVRWYNKTIGPNSFVRQTFPVAKNYIIFLGAVILMHFQGQQLALPPPV